MKNRKFILILLTIGVWLVSGPGSALACVGARPLSMGGAFVGVADDVNAVYWNPAALAMLETPELTYTGMIAERDEVNYDDFTAFVYPLRLDNQNYGTLGLSFINNIDKASVSYDSVLTVDAEAKDQWYVLSYGIKPAENFSLGCNIRHKMLELKLKAQATIGGTTYSAEASDEDEAWGMDLAAFYKIDKFSLGLLVQDINEPEYTLFGTNIRYIRNFRPGISFKPKENILLSAEIYDATDELDRDLRIGGEMWLLEDTFALRVGGYNVNESSDRAATTGFGYRIPSETLGGIAFEIDYACMYWADVPAGTDEFTHMVGFKVSLPWGGEARPTPVKKVEATKRYVVTKAPKKRQASNAQVETFEPSPPKHIEVQKQDITSQKVVTLEEYADLLRDRIKQCLYCPTKGSYDEEVFVQFVVSSNGQIKQIEIVNELSTKDTFLKEFAIHNIKKASPFPAFPEEFAVEELSFELPIGFEG